LEGTVIIDGHVHVWDRSRATKAWLGPHLPKVHRDIVCEETSRDALG
jgi:predicted TIM-barrel fold metal-dependent hydrolase